MPRAANSLCPLSQSRKAIKELKERRRNEPLEVRNIRLERARLHNARKRAMETSPERRARLAQNRWRSANRKKMEADLEKREIYIQECLRRHVVMSELSLNLAQQLDENFIEEAPANSVETVEEKRQRQQRNSLRRQLKNNIKRQEIKRIRLEKNRTKARLKYIKSEVSKGQSSTPVKADILYLYNGYNIDEVKIKSEIIIKAEHIDECD